MNTAASFLRGEGYGFRYTLFFPFPTQSDGPLIIPSVVAIWLLGITPLATQIINLIYVFCSVIAAYSLIQHTTRSMTISLIGSIFLLSVPGFFEYSMNGFGEGIVIFYGIISLFLLSAAMDKTGDRRTILFFCGLMLGLGLITKAIALIMVLSFFSCFSFGLLAYKKNSNKELLFLSMGLILPVIGWEIFRFVELGNLQSYIQWWKLQVGQASHQSGAHKGFVAMVWAKLILHTTLLAGFFGLPNAIVPLFLIVPFLLAGWMAFFGRTSSPGTRIVLLALGSASFFYFAWWLLIAPTHMAWLRRITIGMSLHTLLITVLIGQLIQAVPKPSRLWFTRIALITVLGALILPPILKGQIITMRAGLTESAQDELNLANIVHDLPEDAIIFGFNWWKAPIIRLFSQRPIENINQWEPSDVMQLRSRYLIVDGAAQALAKQDFQQIADRSTLRPLAQGPGGSLYEIIELKDFTPFTPADTKVDRLSSEINIGSDSYLYTRGILPPGGNLAWTEPKFAVLLRRSNQTSLTLRLGLHPAMLKERATVPLYIFSAGCIDTVIQLDKSWLQNLSIPLKCPPELSDTAMEINFQLDGHMPFPPQIDMDGRRLGVLLSEVRLVKD